MKKKENLQDIVFKNISGNNKQYMRDTQKTLMNEILKKTGEFDEMEKEEQRKIAEKNKFLAEVVKNAKVLPEPAEVVDNVKQDRGVEGEC